MNVVMVGREMISKAVLFVSILVFSTRTIALPFPFISNHHVDSSIDSRHSYATKHVSSNISDISMIPGRWSESTEYKSQKANKLIDHTEIKSMPVQKDAT